MSSRLVLTLALAAATGVAAGVCAAPGPQAPPLATQSVPYVPIDVAERMLVLAGVTKNDVVYDLGCGDGRIAIAAAKNYGAHAVGVDSDPKRIAEATANAQRDGVSALVRFVQQDTLDFPEATVVTLTIPQAAPWLTHNGLVHQLLSKQLKPGARIVTTFLPGSMTGWKPSRVDRFTDPQGSPRAMLYLWKVEGTARR